MLWYVVLVTLPFLIVGLTAICFAAAVKRNRRRQSEWGL